MKTYFACSIAIGQKICSACARLGGIGLAYMPISVLPIQVIAFKPSSCSWNPTCAPEGKHRYQTVKHNWHHPSDILYSSDLKASPGVLHKSSEMLEPQMFPSTFLSPFLSHTLGLKIYRAHITWKIVSEFHYCLCEKLAMGFLSEFAKPATRYDFTFLLHVRETHLLSEIVPMKTFQGMIECPFDHLFSTLKRV